MKFTADLHIHSKFSRATSRQCDVPSLYKAARLKGINILATGDFTHPQYFQELKEYLIEDGQGLLDLKEDLKMNLEKDLSFLPSVPMKFIFSVEISSIYKKNQRVRKIHNLILLPDFKSVEAFNKKMAAIGNIHSDGRPILGLDSRNLLEIALEINPQAIFIPAHIWTPWFSLFGMNSGFDTIEECYEDLSKEIFTVETGLSSDPLMNWRLTALDRINLISNSDAHSPEKIAREANLFNTDLNYYKIYAALKDKNSNEFLGTLEFFPEEGKYHFDGHRDCKIRLSPQQAKENHLKCPSCGKKITVGVLHRVEVLADRKEGDKPFLFKSYENLIPLTEIIADAFDVTPASKKVQEIYAHMIQKIGPELRILRESPLEEIKKNTTAVIAEGINRVRNKDVTILPGYDGEYGKIIIFSEEDRVKNVSQNLLLNIEKSTVSPAPVKIKEKKPAQTVDNIKIKKTVSNQMEKSTLNSQQEDAIKQKLGPIIVIAGPGSGKTFTLINKIISITQDDQIPADTVLAIAFTNKAAREIRSRLTEKEISSVKVSTFHSLALDILKENNFNREIFDEYDSIRLLNESLKELNIKRNHYETLNQIMKNKASGLVPQDDELKNIFELYQAKLDHYNGMDFEDIIIFCYKLLKRYSDILIKIKNRYRYILVDEFQDVNYFEYQLIKLISDEGRNLFVIGDPDQCIYTFRGASPEYIFKLKEDYSTAKIIQLKNNYRNPEYIINAAVDVIQHTSQSIKKYSDINILIKSNVKIDMILAPSELSAGIQIAKIITAQVGGSAMYQADIIQSDSEFTFKDFVILVRNSLLIPVLEEVLLHEGLPYIVVGDKSILDDKIIRLAINILRLGLEEINPHRLFQVIESDQFKVPESVIQSLKNKIKENPEIKLLEELKLSAMQISNPNLSLLMQLLSNQISPEMDMESFLRQYSFSFYTKENIQPLLGVSRNFPNLRSFLNNLLLGREQDYEIDKKNLNKLKNIEKISIQTIHSAKGLEFPVVFLFEPVENVIPYLEKDSDLNEERRLFYVAMTRAKEKLFFVIPEKRKLYGHIINTETSRFIDDIQDEWLEIKEAKISEKVIKDKSQLTFW